MKRTLIIFPLLVSSLAMYAQSDTTKTVTLDQLTVNGARVVNRVDGKTLYPTDAQKNATSNGYGLLQRLSLPNLRVDAIAHTIQAVDNRGSVQLRIDNVVVGYTEMMQLEPKRVLRIEFIDNPGLRYGEGVAYVINIITRRNDQGYVLGTDVTAWLTSRQGNALAYSKWNSGKSELSVSYSYWGMKSTKSRDEEEANYTLSDGSIYTIGRNDIEDLYKSRTHYAKLTYNLADSTAFVFQASLSGSFNKTPYNNSLKQIVDGTRQYTSTSRDNSRSSSPVLDLYFFRQITPRQSITANAVGTYIDTQTSSYYDEGAPYQYDVDGKTASLLSEVNYENQFKPFVFSAGMNFRYKHTKNNYTGDASALNKMDQSYVYAFSQIQGALSKFRYSLGAGVSYWDDEQNQHSNTLWSFRPKVTLGYNITDGLQLSYTIEMKDRVSKRAMTSDARIRTNSRETTVGNPDLKPSRDLEQRLNLSYNTMRLSLMLDGYYKHCHHSSMALYERTADDQFIYTQINQKAINVLMVSAYASYWIFPEHLQVAGYGAMMRDFNYGFSYKHHYTSWIYQGSLNAYFGDFTFRGYLDNGYRFLEGETRGYNESSTILSASYKLKNLELSLAWSNPFDSHHKTYDQELLNANLHKRSREYDRDNGNSLTLNVVWRLSQGKKHQSAQKTINLSDSDAGIIK